MFTTSKLRNTMRVNTISHEASGTRSSEPEDKKALDISFEFCQSLPKVELHAHLHGSIPYSTLEELVLKKKEKDCSFPSLPDNSEALDLKSCFQVFNLIHRVIDSLAILRRITIEVVESFAADNVRYLELRSTPRSLDGSGFDGYLATVCDTLQQCSEGSLLGEAIVVRFLVSIDRSRGLDAARDTFQAVLKRRRMGCPFVVGMDFSGNPTKSSFGAYEVFVEDYYDPFF